MATRMGTTRRLAFSLAAIALAAVGVSQSALSGADFTAQSSNPGNNFQAASSFEKVRFASGTYTGNGGDNRQIIGIGFQPDVVIVKGNTNQGAVIRTSTMSGDTSKPLGGGATPGTNRIQSLDADGFTIGTNAIVNSNGVAYHWMAFKSAVGELKLGSYTGNGTSQSITGVGFTPEYVATFSRANDPAVEHFAGMGSTFRFEADTGAPGRITSLDADGFTVGSAATVNRAGTTIDYVAFNDVPGRIDAGSYTGDGTDNRSIAGTGFQPHYVMVRADDTATLRQGAHRSASNAGDSSMHFSATANAADLLQALEADGFQVGTNGNVNANGVSYHHLAIRDGNAGSCSSPGAATVQASADTLVYQGLPTSNFGTVSDLFVRSSSNDNARTLVRFNLPALPSGCSVTGATLRLFSTSAVNGRTIEAYRAAASWTETGATWNNQPGTTGAAANSASGTGWRTWDVASHVQAMYSGANDGFVLRDQTENAAANPQQTYQAREGTPNSQDPELVITFG